MHVEIVAIFDLPTDRVEEWKVLGRDALISCPYFEADYLIPASAYLPGGRDLQLLFSYDDRGMTGALPLVGYHIMGRLKRPSLGTNSGVLDEMADLRVPLLHRDCAREALTALLSFLNHSRSTLPGLLDLGKLPFDAPFDSLITSVCAELKMPYKAGDSYQRGAIVRRPDDQYWLSALTRKRRHDIERTKRKLERELGGVLVSTDRSNDKKFIEEFIEFESNGWKGRVEQGGRGVQVSEGADKWFEEVFSALQKQSRALFMSLAIDGKPLYMGVCILSGESIFCYRDAYDEKWARYGIGFIGRLAIMERFNSLCQLNYLDSTTLPQYTSTTALFPDRRTISSLVIAVGGINDCSLVRAIPHLKNLKVLGVKLVERAKRSIRVLRHRQKSEDESSAAERSSRTKDDIGRKEARS